MAYTATRPDLFNNPGAYAPQGPQVDVGGALEALSGGAASLIHATMLRKQAEFERSRQTAQQAIDTQRYNQQAKWHEDEVGRQIENDRITHMMSGYVPPTPATTTPGASAALAPTAKDVTPVSRIARAMQPTPSATTAVDSSGNVTGSPAGPSYMPAAAPTPAPTTITAPSNTTPGQPERFDPTQGTAYARAQITGELRNQGYMTKSEHDLAAREQLQSERLAAQQNGREFMNQAHLGWIKATEATKNNPVARALTGNQREAYFEKVVAPGLLAQHDGNVQSAIDNLNDGSPQSAQLLKDGFSSNYLAAEADKQSRDRAKAADKKEQGPRGQSPVDAVADVAETRRLIRGGPAKPIDTARQQLTPDSGSPFASTPVTKIAAPVAASAGSAPVTPRTKVAAPVATKPPASANDFSDEEIDAALDAGKESPEDVSAFVLAQRQKKKPVVNKP